MGDAYYMDNTEKQFIELLSKAIRNNRDIKKYNDVNWSNLIDIAEKHKVEGILYATLLDNRDYLEVDNKIIEDLKVVTFYNGIDQIRKVTYLDNIFKKFNEQNISVIALGSLMIKKMYPEADKRSMSHAEILAHNKDLKKIKEILKSIGYEEECENNKNILNFRHRLYPLIKLKWILESENIESEYIWKDSLRQKVLNEEILTLGYEDFLLDIVKRMVNNIYEKGIKLREISDLVLFVENNEDLIDWKVFNSKIKSNKIEKFTCGIFALCNKLFELKIPKQIYDKDIVNNEYLNLLIEDILIGVIFENNDKEKIATNRSIEDISEKKIHVKKNKLLKNIFYLKELYENKVNEDLNFIENIKCIHKWSKILKDRKKIIRWLEL